MPHQNGRPDFESLYPQAKDSYGIAAKQPTHFTIPVIKLSIMLFLPLFLAVAATVIYTYSDETARTTLAINAIALFLGIMLIALLGIATTLSARTIIVRNCSHPMIIELLYVVGIIPATVILSGKIATWYGDASLGNLLLIEAGFIYGMTFLLAIIARLMSRNR